MNHNWCLIVGFVSQYYRFTHDLLKAAHELRKRNVPFRVRDSQGGEWWLTKDIVLKPIP
jgi:hypothetical protein